jgi:hypothetical protein
MSEEDFRLCIVLLLAAALSLLLAIVYTPQPTRIVWRLGDAIVGKPAEATGPPTSESSL